MGRCWQFVFYCQLIRKSHLIRLAPTPIMFCNIHVVSNVYKYQTSPYQNTVFNAFSLLAVNVVTCLLINEPLHRSYHFFFFVSVCHFKVIPNLWQPSSSCCRHDFLHLFIVITVSLALGVSLSICEDSGWRWLLQQCCINFEPNWTEIRKFRTETAEPRSVGF